jgi:prevent-host-death family protein
MKGKVGIAELKAHLSEYVRGAQKGKEVVIKDRETEIAKIVPIRERKPAFRVVPASHPSKGIDDMARFRPTGAKPEEIERVFAETRADRIDEWLNLDTSTSTRR